MKALMDLLAEHQYLLWWMGVGSAFVFVISLLSLPWLVAQIPDDYFVPKKRQPTQWKTRQPLIRLIILIGRNCLGYMLLVGGILMLFLPGQGLLTMITGLLLIDYPGKFRLERKIVNTPTVLKSLNWLRAKAHKPPLI